VRTIAAGAAAVILALLAGIHLGRRSRLGVSPRELAQAGASTLERTSAHPRVPSVARTSSEPGYVTAQAATVTPRLEAYGQVQPISALPVNAAEEGTVTGLSVLPGMHVRTGEDLAHLSGPAIQSALQQSEADIRSARAQLTAAQKTLAIEREQLPSHLTTRAAIQQAESATAQARTNFDNAQSHLQAVRQMMTLSAPADGTVLAINASDGQLMNIGQPVVTLETTAKLWLRASYYGADLSLIRVGMRGVFSPASGSSPIPVRVRAVSGAVTAGEAEMIGLTPATSAAQWVNGEFGSVTVDLPARKLVAVPTCALILDEGKWWVLVHTAQGDHPQEVVPGPARGWNTFLESGLSAGSHVVVEDAYLLFHRGISKAYQPPDQ
jgi:RND family efflux transporter MFP subunit